MSDGIHAMVNASELWKPHGMDCAIASKVIPAGDPGGRDQVERTWGKHLPEELLHSQQTVVG